MKAFSFRLEQALRWRGTQVTTQQSRVATAAAQRSAAQASLTSARAEAASGAADIIDISREPTGFSLSSYASFIDRSRVRIRQLEANLAAAERTLAVERDLLIAANRKLRLLENLKHDAQLRWRTEFERELSAFADEAFLVCQERVHRERDKIGKRTGA
jgi:flagellar export protein FliJ